jgi:hydroxymethylglutaryl-CoA lyase
MKIVEVGPRDGLQNEKTALTVGRRVELINKLADAGLKNIEVGAFVSPKWVPQMQETDKVWEKCTKLKKSKAVPADVDFSVLVPNQKGMENALASSVDHVAIFGACSESFSKKNINCSIEESFARFKDIVQMASDKNIRVRGYLSTCFGCPFEGRVDPKRVVELIGRMLDLGVYEVSIGDTIGVATPLQVRTLLGFLKSNASFDRLAMHFHDTRGTALANVLASFDLGVETFDSSIGSLGGCPYAPGASGNLATEDLVYMLQGMGVDLGINVEDLVEIKKWVEKLVGRDLPSHVGRSGLPLPGTI